MSQHGTAPLLSIWALAVFGVVGCATQASDRQLLRAERIADASYIAGDYGVARQRYEQVLRGKPDHLRAAMRLGAIAYRESDLTAAEQYFAHVVARDARHANARHNLAIVKLSQAMQLLTHYLQLAPGAANRERVEDLIAELDTHKAR